MTEHKCSGCGAYTGHAFNCPLIDLDEARKQLIEYHAAWWKLERADREWTKKIATNAERRVLKSRQQVTLWQGKCAILRHENNRLRAKLQKTNEQA